MENTGVFGIIFVLWFILFIVQRFLSYGTAYRATKRGGDNGVALFGWFIVYELASLIPGLGIYLYMRSKTWHEEAEEEKEATDISRLFKDDDREYNSITEFKDTRKSEI